MPSCQAPAGKAVISEEVFGQNTQASKWIQHNVDVCVHANGCALFELCSIKSINLALWLQHRLCHHVKVTLIKKPNLSVNWDDIIKWTPINIHQLFPACTQKDYWIPVSEVIAQKAR